MERILLIRYGFFKVWIIAFIFILGATVETHADPITFSATAFFTSLAVSAATTAAAILLQAVFTPKPKPIEKNKLQGEIQLSNAGEDLPINEIYGARGSDGLGGIKIGTIYFHASEIYGYVETKSTSGGGGKGGMFRKSGSTKEYHYFIDLACLVGLNRTKILEIKAGTDVLYRNYPKPTDVQGTHYQAESAVLSGGASIIADSQFSGGQKVSMLAGAETQFTVSGDGENHAFYIVYSSNTEITADVTINGLLQTVTLPTTYDRIESVMIVGSTASGNTTVLIRSNVSGWYLDKIVVAEAYASVQENTVRLGGVSGMRKPSYINPYDEYNPYTLTDPNIEDWRSVEEYNYQPNYNNYGEQTAQLPAGCILRLYEGSDTQLPDPMIQEYYEARFGAGSTPAFRYRAYFTLQRFEITKYGAVPNITVIAESMDFGSVGAMYAHRSERAGLIADDEFDYSALNDVPLRGFVISQRQAPKTEMEVINRILDLDVFENPDGVIEGVVPSDDVAAQIPKEDLDVTAAGESAEKVVGIQSAVRTEYELPRRFDFSYFDPRRDYEIGNTHATRQVTVSEKRDNLESSLVLTEEEAQSIVKRLHQKEWTESGAESFQTLWKYGYLRPTDLVEVEDLDGNWNKIRLKARNGNVPGVLKFTGVSRNLPETYPRIFQVTNTTPKNPAFVNIPGHVIGTIFDEAVLRSSDDVPGFYGGCALTDQAYNFSGAALYWERQAGYELLETFKTQATIGRVVGTFGDVPAGWAEGDWDNTTTLTIDNFYGDFESKTETEVLDRANILIVGNEVIAFKTAVRINGYNNRWQLSGLRRRLKGTYSVHVANERTMLLNDTVKFIELDASEFGKTRFYKFVAGGQELDSASKFEFTWDGRSQYNTAPYQITDNAPPILYTEAPQAKLENGIWRVQWKKPLANGYSAANSEIQVIDKTIVASLVTAMLSDGTPSAVDVDSTTNFPTSGKMIVADVDGSGNYSNIETVGYTSLDADTFNGLLRGLERSSVAAHAAGSKLHPVIWQQQLADTMFYDWTRGANDVFFRYRWQNGYRGFPTGSHDGWSIWSQWTMLPGTVSGSPAPPPPTEPPPTEPPPPDGYEDPLNPRYCFACGTLVLMADWSEKPIELIEINDWVKSFDDNGNLIDSQATRLWRNKYERAFSLRFDDGEFDVTGYHPFKRWERKDCLQVSLMAKGDKLTEYVPGNGWRAAIVADDPIRLVAPEAADYFNFEVALYFRYLVKTPGMRGWKAVSNRKEEYSPY